MYEIEFEATTSAGWAGSIEIINDDTNLPFDQLAEAYFYMEVRDDCDGVVLTANSADGSLTRPAVNLVQWEFTPQQIGACRHDRTYKVGLVVYYEGKPNQIFIGRLVVIDGFVTQDVDLPDSQALYGQDDDGTAVILKGKV